MKEDTVSDTVRVFDPATGQISIIPASELASGMILARIEGMKGTVYIDAASLHLDPETAPHDLSPGQMAKIRVLHEIIQDVCGMDLSEWISGFALEPYPDNEIERVGFRDRTSQW